MVNGPKNKSLHQVGVKYPRTYHLPWSEGLQDDDRMMESTSTFIGRDVVVTEKLDGENTSMYTNHIHARSLDSRNHPSRNWVKNFWSGIAYNIPEGYRICGENMFAQHSIPYTNLGTYFFGFSVWNQDICLSWEETLRWFDLLGITPVPILYYGAYDEQLVQNLWKGVDPSKHEGYVVRLADSFTLQEFRSSVGKFVRKNHVQTPNHWMHDTSITQNGL